MHCSRPSGTFWTAETPDPASATTICSDGHGGVTTYAPHGYGDLFGRNVVPNPVLAPREVYLSKTLRWSTEWPSLNIHPWPAANV
ncbi:nucleotidyltransferase family protein [Arthrobacter sp. NPDC093128]|uniref:nucleotidyltransferase family protein n=1 Tax=Arthrobacter sp. NPDC093128 TaxID=3154979 RepID=UPI00341D7FB3